MPLTPPIDPDVLAREAAGVRRLAQGLLGDPHLADDAAQETLRVGLERGPRAGFAPAAWLRGVLRNVVRRMRRSATRRRAWEHAAAAAQTGRGDAMPADRSGDESHDAVTRLARRRAVLDAVLTLPEALRTAVELRFFEGLPPRVIAKRLGVPVETVRSRVRRAIELLREDFDRRERGAPGARRRWALALVPLAFPSRADVGPWILGGAVMGAKAKALIVTAAVALVAVGSALAFRSNDSAASRPDDAPPPLLAAEKPAGALAAGGKALKPAAATDALPPGSYRARVTGRVIDADDAPIAGARILLGSADEFDDLARAPDATTDAAGRFAVESVGPFVAWRVQASAPGHRRASATAAAGAERDVVLRMSRSAPLWLEVRDATKDEPLEGADVTLVSADEGGHVTERQRTDARGRARVEDPGSRSMAFDSTSFLRIVAPGTIPFSTSLYEAARPGSTSEARPFRVSLARGAPLAFQVIDRDGKPVAGAELLGWTGSYAGQIAVGTMLRQVPNAAETLGTATTDAEGRAAFSVVSGRWYVLAKKGDDVGLAFGEGVTNDRRGSIATIGRDAETTIRLTPSLQVDGVVVDERGAAERDVKVSLTLNDYYGGNTLPPAAMSEIFSARTDAAGRFHLSGVPAHPRKREIHVGATSEDMRMGGASVVSGSEPGAATARVVLKRLGGPSRQFLVRSSAGSPVAGALVVVPFLFPAARTDADGRATLGAADAAALAQRGVDVTAPGFARRRVAVSEDASKDPVDVTLDAEAILDLVVRAPDGKPVPFAQVYVASAPDLATAETVLRDRGDARSLFGQYTDADGRVRADGLPRESVFVSAEFFEGARRGNEERNRTIVSMATPGPIEIVLPRAPYDPLTGSVVEGDVVAADGSQVLRYNAALQSPRGNFQAVVAGRRFRFEGIPPGRYQLQIYVFPTSASDPQVPVLQDVEVEAGRDRLDVRAVVTAPGSISGRVSADGAIDVSGIPVEAVDTRGLTSVRGRATTDGVGAFRFKDLPAGPYRIVLKAPAGERVPVVAQDAPPIVVAAGAEARVEVKASPAARIVLVCDDARIAVRPTKFETTQDFHTSEYQTNLILTSPDGRKETGFNLYRGRNETAWALPPGRYHLRVRRFPSAEFEADVEIVRAGDVEVTVDFGKTLR